MAEFKGAAKCGRAPNPFASQTGQAERSAEKQALSSIKIKAQSNPGSLI